MAGKPYGCKVLRSSHPEVGEEVTRCFWLGRLHLNVSRGVGVYGFRDTVSWALRWWMT